MMCEQGSANRWDVKFLKAWSARLLTNAAYVRLCLARTFVTLACPLPGDVMAYLAIHIEGAYRRIVLRASEEHACAGQPLVFGTRADVPGTGGMLVMRAHAREYIHDIVHGWANHLGPPTRRGAVQLTVGAVQLTTSTTAVFDGASVRIELYGPGGGAARRRQVPGLATVNRARGWFEECVMLGENRVRLSPGNPVMWGGWTTGTHMSCGPDISGQSAEVACRVSDLVLVPDKIRISGAGF